MPATLLAASDIHLGRRPSRLPDDLAELGLDPSEVTPAAAWKSAVRVAIERDVDAVLLAGDVVESLADRFRALRVIEEGVELLLSRGISVIAVAGNHDVIALPRLADIMAGPGTGHAAAPGGLGRDRAAFRLLGRGGRWESVLLTARDGTKVRIVGWSFASEKERDNPLDTFPDERNEGVATVGLLHCDVDGGASPYAPVPRSRLTDAPVDAWLLGHVHVPDRMESSRPIGYLGSLVGLDPGESGQRGAWLFRVDGPGTIVTERLPVAPLRWERVEAPVGTLAGEAPDGIEQTLDGLLVDTLVSVRDAIDSSLGDTRLVGCRITLTGEMKHHLALARLLDQGPWRELTKKRGGVTLFVESVIDAITPAVDLAGLAASDDPPGLLARMLLDLEQETESGRALVEGASRALRRAEDAGAWNRASVALPPRDDRRLLLRAGRLALQELLAQRGQGGSP